METYISIGVGVIIVGLVGYIWSTAMTPVKCNYSHKEIIDAIKVQFIDHRMQMEKIIELVVENKILKEMRRIDDRNSNNK
jgi:hypothetical protein